MGYSTDRAKRIAESFTYSSREAHAFSGYEADGIHCLTGPLRAAVSSPFKFATDDGQRTLLALKECENCGEENNRQCK